MGFAWGLLGDGQKGVREICLGMNFLIEMFGEGDFGDYSAWGFAWGGFRWVTDSTQAVPEISKVHQSVNVKSLIINVKLLNRDVHRLSKNVAALQRRFQKGHKSLKFLAESRKHIISLSTQTMKRKALLKGGWVQKNGNIHEQN